MILPAQEVRTHEGKQVKPTQFIFPNTTCIWNGARRGQEHGGGGNVLVSRVRLGLKDPEHSSVTAIFREASLLEHWQITRS